MVGISRDRLWETVLLLEIVFYIPVYKKVGRLSGGVKKNLYDSEMSRSLVKGLN